MMTLDEALDYLCFMFQFGLLIPICLVLLALPSAVLTLIIWGLLALIGVV